jgi:hypothetical protein
MSVAFVLGNGLSRKPIPLEPLKQSGKVYACNAVYRTFTPDYLVAVDAKMINEICTAGAQLKMPVWTNPNKAYKKFPKLNYFEPSMGWSSGPTALWLASKHGHQLIYILGFDFTGTKEGRLNNIFGDTPNYKKNTDVATYHGNWNRQTCIVLQKNSLKRYIRVVPEGTDVFEASDLKKYANYSEITVQEFKRRYRL